MAPPRIPWAKPHFWKNEVAYASEAVASTWISGGPFVERFERELATFAGARHAVAVSNGTTALHLAYLALGIGRGDEVIVPGFAFMAAANIARHVGAVPVFAEVDTQTWCLDASDVARRVSPRTKAIVPVHTYGNVCDMNALCAVAEVRRIPIIEDAAEAFASRYDGRLAGTIGLLGTESFHATKLITTGEGGAVFTEDSELYDRMLLYRSHGLRRKRHYWHELEGHNFRLTNMQAAVGCAQLEHVDAISRERRRVHHCYAERLGQMDGLTLQRFAPEVEPVLWAMAARLDPRAYPQGRDAIMEAMDAQGIETRPGFYTASALGLHASDMLPVCEDISRTLISLPTFPTLTDQEIDFVCDVLIGLRR